MSKRKPLSPEATEKLNRALLTLAEYFERRKAERDAENLAEKFGKLADEMGANV